MSEQIDPNEQADFLNLANTAYDNFTRLVSGDKSEIDSRLREAMIGITALSAGFAMAMTDQKMPVERYNEYFFEKEPESFMESARLISTISHPLWPVLTVRDLSGRPMQTATITPTRTSRDKVKPIDINPKEAKDIFVGTNQVLTYKESVIAVSSVGELLRLTRSYIRTPGGSNFNRSNLRVVHQSVRPSDLFSTEEQPIESAKLIAEMETRLSDTGRKYQLELIAENERNNRSHGGSVFRGDTYYEKIVKTEQDRDTPSSTPIPDDAPRPSKSWPRRILGR